VYNFRKAAKTPISCQGHSPHPLRKHHGSMTGYGSFWQRLEGGFCSVTCATLNSNYLHTLTLNPREPSAQCKSCAVERCVFFFRKSTTPLRLKATLVYGTLVAVSLGKRTRGGDDLREGVCSATSLGFAQPPV
jgi:hypothetical protein